jgi:hypothetical protein
MLLGIWKNIKELEEELCIAELELVLSAARKQKEEDRKFMAAVQGIDIDSGENDAVDRVEQMKREVEARQRGISSEQLELEDLGFSYDSD